MKTSATLIACRSLVTWGACPRRCRCPEGAATRSGSGRRRTTRA